MTPEAWHGVLFVCSWLCVFLLGAVLILAVSGRRPRGRVNRLLVVSGVPDVEDGER